MMGLLSARTHHISRDQSRNRRFRKRNFGIAKFAPSTVFDDNPKTDAPTLCGTVTELPCVELATAHVCTTGARSRLSHVRGARI